jgi:hypothetical protein
MESYSCAQCKLDAYQLLADLIHCKNGYGKETEMFYSLDIATKINLQLKNSRHKNIISKN